MKEKVAMLDKIGRNIVGLNEDPLLEIAWKD